LSEIEANLTKAALFGASLTKLCRVSSISLGVICLFIFFSSLIRSDVHFASLFLHALGIGRMSPRFRFVSFVFRLWAKPTIQEVMYY
jgi:hypothetical protein